MSRNVGWISGILATVLISGCELTPPSEGYHYETTTVGKHPERKAVKDREPEDNVVKVPSTVPTEPLEPGIGEHYEYQYRGRYASKVVLKDVEVSHVPVEVIEVSADQRCPKCHWDYVTVGKRSMIKWFCDAKNHGLKAPVQVTAVQSP